MNRKFGLFSLALIFVASAGLAQSSNIYWVDLRPGNTVVFEQREWASIKPGRKSEGLDELYGIFYLEGTLRFQNYTKDVVATLIGEVPHVTPLKKGDVLGRDSNWELTYDYGEDGRFLSVISSPDYTVWNGKTAYAGFQILIDGDTHYGWIQMTVALDGQSVTLDEMGYAREAEAEIVVGERWHYTLDTKIQRSRAMCFSLTNIGRIGYITHSHYVYNDCPPRDEQATGGGISYRGRRMIYEAGILMGTDQNRLLSTVEGDDYWQAQDTDLTPRPNTPISVVRDAGTQIGTVEYVDTYAVNPLGVSIVQNSFSFDAEEDAGFIIFRYLVTNESTTDIKNMFAGLWVDWSVGRGHIIENSIKFDAARKMGFAESATKSEVYQVAGIRVLSENYSTIDSYAMDVNEEIVETPTRRTRRGKWDVLSGRAQRRVLFGKDVAQIATVGPINIPSGATRTIAFAIVAGESEGELFNNADRALDVYNSDKIPLTSQGEQPTHREWFRISDPFPNPVVQQASFKYSLTRSAYLEVDVYDILGRHVQRLLATRMGIGQHNITWNIDNASVASGIYTVRWNIEQEEHRYTDAQFVIVQ